MFVSGQVAKLIRNSRGRLTAIFLEDGRELRFPEEFGELVSSVVTEHCAVRIEADSDSENFRQGNLRAILITNTHTKHAAWLVNNGTDCGSLTDGDFEPSTSDLSEPIGSAPLHPASNFRSILRGFRGFSVTCTP